MVIFIRRDVERLPDTPESGVLYVSEKFRMTLHACACGCGHRVYTFLGDGHRLFGTPDEPTIEPSIGVWDAPCKSHYFIEHGQVRWSKSFTEAQIQQSMKRQLDRHVDASKRDEHSRKWYNRIYAKFRRLVKK